MAVPPYAQRSRLRHSAGGAAGDALTGRAGATWRLIRDRALREQRDREAAELVRAKVDIRDRAKDYAAVYEKAYSEATLPCQIDLWRQRMFGSRPQEGPPPTARAWVRRFWKRPATFLNRGSPAGSPRND